MRTSNIFLRSRHAGGHTGFQRLNESVRGVPNSEEQMVAEKMRSLLRFGAGWAAGMIACILVLAELFELHIYFMLLEKKRKRISTNSA